MLVDSIHSNIQFFQNLYWLSKHLYFRFNQRIIKMLYKRYLKELSVVMT